MPRVVTAAAHKPSLQFRYQMQTSKLPGAKLYARSTQQPGADNAPVSVEHINYYFKVKGKTRWNDVNLQLYHFEGITAKEVWAYLNEHQKVPGAVDAYAAEYKHDMQLQILGPDGSTPTGTWKLVGAMIASTNFGDMDWGTDDVVQCELVIAYDHAEFS